VLSQALSTQHSVIVAVAIFELHIPHAQSLKEKRMVVRSLRDKLRHRFEISANEVAMQDLHQRARMAVSFVASDDATADGILDKIHTFVEGNTDGQLIGWTSEKLDFDESIAL
jgi:uncharacterized protein YlxP (DUF503 family)